MRHYGLLALILCAAAATAAEPEKSLLQVVVTHQEYDPHSPWQKEQPAVRVGYGVMIDDTHLLTTEDLIRNSTLIETRQSMRGEKCAASVEVADYQVDLAILKIGDALHDATAPVILATNVPRDASLQILQFDETAAIQRGAATILKIAVTALPAAPNSSLTFTLQTDVNPNGAGAPVFCKGEMAGMIVNYDRNTRTATMLPYAVIERFRQDALLRPYRGLPSAGFLWTSLVDPAKRAYLGAPAGDQGIMTLNVLAGTGARDALKPGDVIIEWDGRRVDDLGFYDDPVFGRLLIPYLIGGRRHPGEAVPVRLIRDRKEIGAQVGLARRLDADSLIPENIAGDQPEYIAEAGYIIRELTGDYLRAYGGKWDVQANPRLVHLYLSKAQQPETPGDRVVILARVLPDPINIGAHNFHDEVVTHINGEAIRNMDDLFRIVDRDGALRKISLQGMGVDIVVDEELLPRANERISRMYGVSRLQHRKTEAGPRMVKDRL